MNNLIIDDCIKIENNLLDSYLNYLTLGNLEVYDAVVENQKLKIINNINFNSINKYNKNIYLCNKKLVIQNYLLNIAHKTDEKKYQNYLPDLAKYIEENYEDLLISLKKEKKIKKKGGSKKLVKKKSEEDKKELDEVKTELDELRDYINYGFRSCLSNLDESNMIFNGINFVEMTETIDRENIDIKYDILIVGMGPVGLLLALLLLGRYTNIKIIILDNRIKVEKIKKPFNMDILRLNINERFLKYYKSLCSTPKNTSLNSEIQFNKGYCTLVISLYIYLVSRFKKRFFTYYTKNDLEEIIEELDINFVLDCTGGRNEQIVNNNINFEKFLNFLFLKVNIDEEVKSKGKKESNTEIKKKDILKEYVKQSKNNYYISKNLDSIVKKRYNQLKIIDISTKSISNGVNINEKLKYFLGNDRLVNFHPYYTKLEEYMKDKIIVEEKVELITPTLEISKKELSNYKNNFVNILCGMGLIKTAPKIGKTLELSIGIFILCIIPILDNIFVKRKTLSQFNFKIFNQYLVQQILSTVYLIN